MACAGKERCFWGPCSGGRIFSLCVGSLASPSSRRCLMAVASMQARAALREAWSAPLCALSRRWGLRRPTLFRLPQSIARCYPTSDRERGCPTLSDPRRVSLHFVTPASCRRFVLSEAVIPSVLRVPARIALRVEGSLFAFDVAVVSRCHPEPQRAEARCASRDLSSCAEFALPYLAARCEEVCEAALVQPLGLTN